MRAHFIDPPSEFAPLAEWEAFLAEILRLDPADKGVADEIDRARAKIDRLKSLPGNVENIFSPS